MVARTGDCAPVDVTQVREAGEEKEKGLIEEGNGNEGGIEHDSVIDQKPGLAEVTKSVRNPKQARISSIFKQTPFLKATRNLHVSYLLTDHNLVLNEMIRFCRPTY